MRIYRVTLLLRVAPQEESCPKLVEMESLQILGYVWKILPKDFLKFTYSNLNCKMIKFINFDEECYEIRIEIKF